MTRHEVIRQTAPPVVSFQREWTVLTATRTHQLDPKAEVRICWSYKIVRTLYFVPIINKVVRFLSVYYWNTEAPVNQIMCIMDIFSDTAHNFFNQWHRVVVSWIFNNAYSFSTNYGWKLSENYGEKPGLTLGLQLGISWTRPAIAGLVAL